MFIFAPFKLTISLIYFMKRLIMAALALLLSVYAYADAVSAFCITTDADSTPRYFTVNESASIRFTDTSLIVITEYVRMEFPLDDNPQIVFTEVDESLIEGHVSIDRVSIEATDAHVFSIDGSEKDSSNLTTGTYIVRRNNQSYKIIIR